MNKEKDFTMIGTEVFVVGIIFFTLFLVIRTLSNNNLRKRIIERGIDQDQIKHLFDNIDQNIHISYGSMKFGLISLVIGLSLIIVDAFRMSDEVATAVFFIGIGLVLVIFPKIEEHFSRK